jgi:hypothetical protein
MTDVEPVETDERLFITETRLAELSDKIESLRQMSKRVT